MKKLIAVAAILSVMFLGAGTSQALMGVPDAVPGRDILVPFFLVSMPGEGSDNSLITVTDVTGVCIDPFDVVDPLHLTLMDIDSNVVFDKWIDMTEFDVYVTDAKSIILDEMSIAGRAALEIDLDGVGGVDHWAGYIHFEADDGMAVAPFLNNFIAHVYQVSVSDGMVAGYTGVSLEDAAGGAGDPVMLVGYGDLTLDFNDVEALSANALHGAKELLRTAAPAAVLADWFRLMPRYYLYDAASENYLIIWTDVFDGNADGDLDDATDIALPGDLHINFFDEEENVISSTITIDHELNFIDLKNVIPGGYTAGWIDIQTPDLLGNGWNNGAHILDGDRYLLGYSLQRARMADGTTLDVILEAHRDAGVLPQPGL